MDQEKKIRIYVMGMAKEIEEAIENILQKVGRKTSKKIDSEIESLSNTLVNLQSLALDWNEDLFLEDPSFPPYSDEVQAWFSTRRLEMELRGQ